MKKKLILILVIFLFGLNLLYSDNNYLVKINGNAYSKKDFEIWWKYWKDKDTPFPDTPDKFINWILLSDEAKAMGFESEESYKRKLKVFREVRSLLQLRYDEVEKKININPDSLWKFYNKEYAPLYKIKIIITDNKTEANNWKKFLKNSKNFNKLFKKLEAKNKAKDLGYQRPIGIPEVFKSTVFNAKINKVYGPIVFKKNIYFLMVTEKFPGTKKDYNKIHQNIAYRYKKYMSDKLTEELLKKLRKKYHVEVNWNLINKVKPFEKIDKNFENKIVIKIEDKTLTLSEFKKSLEKDIESRNLKGKLKGEKLENYKKGFVNGIINQTLTTLEALNRHYENTVMRDIYWFYKRNRLIAEFENKIILPQVKITDTEIKKYYDTHIKDFTKPEMVKIAVIQTKDEKLIKKAYSKLKNGENFFEVAREIQFHGAKPEYRRMDNLVKEVRKAVMKMKPGETSKIIKHNDWFFIIKLFKKEKEEVHDLKKVKKHIKNILFKKRFQEIKDNYIKKLRERSKIEVNEKLWEEILYKNKAEGRR